MTSGRCSVLRSVTIMRVSTPATRFAHRATTLVWVMADIMATGCSTRRYRTSPGQDRSTRRCPRSTTETPGGTSGSNGPSALASRREERTPTRENSLASVSMTRSAPPPRSEGKKNATLPDPSPGFIAEGLGQDATRLPTRYARRRLATSRSLGRLPAPGPVFHRTATRAWRHR